MTKIKVTEEQFTAAMREAVAERGPDFVYPLGEEGWTDGGETCRYVRADVDEPACIIGMALHKVGVPLGQFEDVEGLAADEAIKLLVNTSDKVKSAAADAQTRQDQGRTWGDALAAYEEGVETNDDHS